MTEREPHDLVVVSGQSEVLVTELLMLLELEMLMELPLPFTS